MTWSVDVLHYATGLVPGAQVRWLTGFDQWQVFHFNAFLLRQDGQNVLVDCGIDDLDVFNTVLRSTLGERGLLHPAGPGVSIRSLLAERGLEPRDIDVVALTHLHIDHVANAQMFRNATFLMSRVGYERHADLERRLPEMVPEAVFPSGAIGFLREKPGRLELVDDGPTALAGISAKHVGGHTADCTAFIVDGDIGKVIFPSDTAWTALNIAERHPPGSVVNVAECYEAFRWLNATKGIVLPPHDAQLSDLLSRKADEPRTNEEV
ncbi:MBL fold metallo-hydrolase [Conexibacter sp. S30A1]|uniref:MBL fold metallo-hydrolase n=1 Tax=Conexibacter sp. S30A1 TaxID=2937800 RepID=UPI00200F516D|nr:MBL fold metallo-hydrolase [Conexibacter sp. S30A1]